MPTETQKKGSFLEDPFFIRQTGPSVPRSSSQKENDSDKKKAAPKEQPF